MYFPCLRVVLANYNMACEAIDISNTTFDLSANANMVGNGGVDLTGAGASLTATYYGGVWHCVCTTAT